MVQKLFAHNPAWASLPLFDRTGWKRMAFGDFAESIGERVEPKDAQEEADMRRKLNFKDEPGFTRVVPIEEIRAKVGNLSISLYVGADKQAQTDAATALLHCRMRLRSGSQAHKIFA